MSEKNEIGSRFDWHSTIDRATAAANRLASFAGAATQLVPLPLDSIKATAGQVTERAVDATAIVRQVGGLALHEIEQQAKQAATVVPHFIEETNVPILSGVAETFTKILSSRLGLRLRAEDAARSGAGEPPADDNEITS